VSIVVVIDSCPNRAWMCGRGAPSATSQATWVSQVVEPERRDAPGRERLHQLAPDVGVEVAVVQQRPWRVMNTKSSGAFSAICRANAAATTGEIEMVRRDLAVFGLPR
jgi:hypothetical protein